MRINLLFRYVLKDIRFSAASNLFLLVVLYFGFLAIFISQTFRASTDRFVEAKAAKMLGADLALYSQEPIPSSAVDKVQEIFPAQAQTQLTETISMVRANDRAMMANIRGIHGEYPLVGEFATKMNAELKGGLKDDSVWIGQEVADQLKLGIGDNLRVGEASFRIDDIVQVDSVSTRLGFALMPRIYLPLESIAKTKLIQFGSQVRHYHMLRYPVSLSSEVLSLFEKALENSSTRLRSPQRAIRGLDRSLNVANQFFALISLIVVLICFLAGYYLIQVDVRQKIFQIGVYQCFGMSNTEVRALYFMYIAVIIFAASGLAGITIYPLVGLLNFTRIFPQDFFVVVPNQIWLQVMAVSVGCLFAFSLPLFATLYRTSAKVLLEESGPDLPASVTTFIPYLTSLLFFFFISAWLFNSFWMAATFLAITTVFSVFAVLLLPWIMRSIKDVVPNTIMKLAVLTLSKARFATGLFFIGVAFASFFLTFVPHLLKTVANEIAPENRERLPQLFVINISEEEKEPLLKFLRDKNVELENLSPFLLARLEEKNGKEVQNKRFLRFPVRISYRAEMIESESLFRGKEIPGTYSAERQKLPYISMEYRFADRNNFRIGDTLKFFIQGIEVEGVIKNLRKVRWNSFQPNYFIQFQEGVLNDFPKTYIGVVKGIEQKKLASFKYQFIEAFPRVTTIDIAETVQRLAEITEKFSLPLLLLGILAIAISLFVTIAILVKSIWQSNFSIQLYKVLSGSYRSVVWLQLFEYGLLLFWAAGVGIVFSYLAAWYILGYQLALAVQFAHLEAVAALFLLSALVFFGVYLAVLALLRNRSESEVLF